MRETLLPYEIVISLFLTLAQGRSLAPFIKRTIKNILEGSPVFAGDAPVIVLAWHSVANELSDALPPTRFEIMSDQKISLSFKIPKDYADALTTYLLGLDLHCGFTDSAKENLFLALCTLLESLQQNRGNLSGSMRLVLRREPPNPQTIKPSVEQLGKFEAPPSSNVGRSLHNNRRATETDSQILDKYQLARNRFSIERQSKKENEIKEHSKNALQRYKILRKKLKYGISHSEAAELWSFQNELEKEPSVRLTLKAMLTHEDDGISMVAPLPPAPERRRNEVCPACDGDGGAAGACYKCDGTGWL